MGYKKLKVDPPPLPPMTHFLQGGCTSQRFYNKGSQRTLPAEDQVFKYVSGGGGAFQLQTTTVGKEGDMAESKGPIFEKEGEH